MSYSSFTPPPDNGYITNDVLSFTLTFSTSVYVNTGGGTPYLSLSAISGNVGTGNIGKAYYFSGSGTNTLTFHYTVAVTDVATLGITIAPYIIPNGGNIQNGRLCFLASDMSNVVLNSHYSYARTITIDHTKVGTVNNTDQTNFPVLVSGTYTYLANGNGNGTTASVTNSNGYDIIFTSDNTCRNKLSFEKESYDSVTGAASFWVKVPLVSHSADASTTPIYLCYSNSAVSVPQNTASNAWDSYYKGVWHLPNGTSLTSLDSTTNANNGTLTNSPTAVAGAIGGGANFNGSSQYMSAGTSNIGATAITVSSWVKVNAFTNGTFGWDSNLGSVAFSTRNADSDVSPTLGTSPAPGSQLAFFGPDSAGLFNGAKGTTVISTGVWYYLTGTYDNAGTWRVYVNGALEGTNNYNLAGTYGGTFTGYPWRFAYTPQWGTTRSTEVLDEARLSTVARSSDWIITEFNNQNSPGTFYTIGSVFTP